MGEIDFSAFAAKCLTIGDIRSLNLIETIRFDHQAD